MQVEQPEASSSKPKPPPIVDFTSGVIAGAAGLVVGQPFDVVKVRYQTPEFAGRYASTFGAFGAIVREEKVHGLFKGVLSPMAGIAFINGVVFSSYSLFMRLQLPRENGGEPSLGQICLAGAGSGVIGALLTCPTELIKVGAAPRLRNHVPARMMARLRDAMTADRALTSLADPSAVRSATPRSLHTRRGAVHHPHRWLSGALSGFHRDSTAGSGIWTVLLHKPAPPPSSSVGSRRHHHESLIEEAEEELGSLGWAELMTAGGLAGVTAWVATFPFDVFKTRLQAASWDESNGTVRRANDGLWRVAVDAVRREGWRVMFAGLGPTLIRAVPVNMVVFVTFEACVSALSR
ncbi:hypothetical protein EHS25_005079 [Saitozyma podzolica]|uniref:Uncharacterized protein n=1 Tax=Saitozyma podzolica TaxID=1890683 RepID=A0A427Y2E6_9TREE|nr:hypothetical protein EHS25_005079 [Saitozyma podzolica]